MVLALAQSFSPATAVTKVSAEERRITLFVATFGALLLLRRSFTG